MNLTEDKTDPALKPVWTLSEGDVATIYGMLYGPEDDPDGDGWAAWWDQEVSDDKKEDLKRAASDAIGYVWADALDSAFREYPFEAAAK